MCCVLCVCVNCMCCVCMCLCVNCVCCRELLSQVFFCEAVLLVQCAQTMGLAPSTTHTQANTQISMHIFTYVLLYCMFVYIIVYNICIIIIYVCKCVHINFYCNFVYIWYVPYLVKTVKAV